MYLNAQQILIVYTLWNDDQDQDNSFQSNPVQLTSSFFLSFLSSFYCDYLKD